MHRSGLSDEFWTWLIWVAGYTKMGYWKTTVLPQIKKAFGKDPAKKAAALEACKSFDVCKVPISILCFFLLFFWVRMRYDG